MAEADAPRPAGGGLTWWLALIALAVATPWPSWKPPLPIAAATVVVLLVASRPRGWSLAAWLGPLVAVGLLLIHPGGEPETSRLEEQLSRRCRQMVDRVETVARTPELQRLFAASGEALDPGLPFEVLARHGGGARGRTLYLADDRGRVVAWSGDAEAYPHRVRPLGPRAWGVTWSATEAVLFLREPVLLDGRMVGTVTIADRSPLVTETAWGMLAPRGTELVLGDEAPRAHLLQPAGAPGVAVRLGWRPVAVGRTSSWLPWLLLAAASLALRPEVGPLVVLLGCAAAMELPLPVRIGATALLLGAAVGRLSRRLPVPWSRLLVLVAIVAAAATTLLLPTQEVSSWLPEHLLRPGWGVVWMISLAWAASGFPFRRRLGLGRRLTVAGLLALLGLGVELSRLPVELERARGGGEPARVPTGEVTLEPVLPASPEECRLDDLAPAFAGRWGLEEWQVPSQLRLLSAEGGELSRWGDLLPAGDAVREARRWSFDSLPGTTLYLDVAEEPWRLLVDWPVGGRLDDRAEGPVWSAVYTRSGTVAASLSSVVRDLDPAIAGDLYYAGRGWAWLPVGDERNLARFWRQGEWLVAAVARHPAPAVLGLQAAIAMVWAFLALAVGRPPSVGRIQMTTFGGRLRVLVAGGAVLPLIVLTVFLHQRLQREEHRLEQVFGLDALQAVTYTAGHLGGGFAVDDELARWLATGWGGEVVLFDGAEVAAVSRSDLMIAGVLPQLPVADAFPSYLVGRNDPLVTGRRRMLVGVAPVDLQGRRLLLHLFLPDPVRARRGPGAVDWLLTGAILSALLSLALTTRVERRLSVSLRDLVAMARRLLHGEPLGDVRRPREADLAEVLDAVRTMSEEVQQREQSLRHQEELLRITLATLAPAVLVLEPDGKVRFTNPSAVRLQEEHGDRVLAIVREIAGPGLDPDRARVETVQPTPGRELTWRVGVAGAPLPDGRRGLVAVVDDVTDVVRVDRLRQLNQLARIVAHEVKNPLTPVRLWVQEVDEARRRGDPRLAEIVDEACREIGVQVERLQETASSFSNLVALERWEPERVDLTALAEDVLRELVVLERRGFRITRDFAPPGECVVNGDRGWLRRALGNLVKNSVDALGEVAGEIRVRTTSEGNERVLEVEDTAGGVPEDTLADLFSPHFSTTTAGSGLGLALVHQVALRCQGRVDAGNGEHGLRVRVMIPAADPSATMPP